ncbi:MAG: phosphatidic acid phosphatase [Oscillospiraceae bacterium]|nr:phosphatidic acid phosphatase [Oscillospiraceae bacterium]
MKKVYPMKNVNSKETKQYYFVSLFLMLLSNRIIFWLSHFLSRNTLHFDLSLPADALIPFMPWTILIYGGVNIWWIYIYWLVAGCERQESNHFFCAQLVAKTASFLFFIFLPTTITRPELKGNSIWIFLMRFLYRIDTPDNLFPSIHCMLGWICWIAVRGKKDISIGIRTLSFLLAVAVCASTLTVRQHVIMDVAGGILLSEISYMLADNAALSSLYAKLVNWFIRNSTSLQRGADMRKALNSGS